MVPDEPPYPASPWQTVGLLALSAIVFGLAVYGGIDLAIRITVWFAG